MQIHELNTFSGTPGAGDYLAIDDGTETTKIPATEVGTTYGAMTQAEAEAGTGTTPKVIAPKVLHDYVEGQDPEIIIVNSVSLGQITANQSGALTGTVDVSSSIPAGYSLAGVIPRSSGSYWCYIYACMVAAPSSVTIQMMRAMSSNTTTTPTVSLICKKD